MGWHGEAPAPASGDNGVTLGMLNFSPAGISAKRPEISRSASAQREVESAIMLTWSPMSRKYSDSVMPAVEGAQGGTGDRATAVTVVVPCCLPV